ncbi:hypothetical protein MHD_05830 [Mannheimia granulomatis]|nr:dTDP-4-amino-4,6-dideoxy-D-galactose acyltransferase [Mannheimia granulomatis]RGE47997.1 hypothetical protein MHD_05830 [Mannheimia granulomatis]
MITIDQWLSDFFDREIVQVKVKAEDLAQIEELQKQGFVWVEGEIEFELNLGEYAKFPEKTTACQIATPQDIEALQLLFGSAFPNSRFRPPYFSIEENQRLYQEWVTNAVKGSFDDLCLVKRNEEGEIQGGVTLRLKQNQATIGLLAVAPKFQRQGIACELLNAAILWASKNSAELLKISTQTSNLKAIRLYQRLGAEVKAIYYWFYPRKYDDKLKFYLI